MSEASSTATVFGAHGLERRPEYHGRDASLAVVGSDHDVADPAERGGGRVCAVDDGAAEADELVVLVEDAVRAGHAAGLRGVVVRGGGE
jgi:hypothetical protein